jgi:hypothetical protein
VSNSSFQKLFNRRPTTATIGLSIAAISFFATMLQGVFYLLSSTGDIFFDFTYSVDFAGADLTFRQALVGCSWALIGLVACYLAQEPRNMARFTVLIVSGVKLLALLTLSQASGSQWQQLVALGIASAPIILLLLPPSNQYYGRQQ